MRLDAGSPTGARITYVMNDAAIPLEAFIRTYPEIPNSQSARPLSLLTHAATLGFDPDVLSADPDRVKTPDAQWIAEWATIQRQTEECSPEPPMSGDPDLDQALCGGYRAWSRQAARLSPNIAPQVDYTVRWRAPRPPGTGEVEGERGPWLNFFAGNLNLEGVAIVNAYNETDHVLRVDQNSGIIPPHAWHLVQVNGKPYTTFVGLSFLPEANDDLLKQHWVSLLNTSNTAEMADLARLWGDGQSHAGQLRQWAELAFWYPAITVAVGAHSLPAAAANIDFTLLGGSEGPPLVGGNGVPSHTYLWITPLPGPIWHAFTSLAAVMPEAER